MGFLDFFRRGKQERGPEPRQAGVTELPESGVSEWFSRTFSREMARTRADARKLIAGADSSFSGLESSLRKLDAARFRGEERVHSAANMVKDLVVKRGQSAVSSVRSSLPEAEYSSMKEFHSEARKALEEISDLTPKQSYLLNTYFPQPVSDFVESIKAATGRIEDMGSFLENQARIMLAERELGSLLRERSELAGKARALEKQKRQSLDRTESLKRNEESLEGDMEALLKSEDHSRLTELEKRAKILEIEMENARKEILSHLSPLEKPLKKFEYFCGKGHPLSPEQERLLERLITDPFEAVIRSDEVGVQEIVFLMERAIDEGAMSVKPSEKHKIRVAYESLDSDLPGLRDRYLSLELEAGAVRSRIGDYSGVRDRKEAIGALIENNRQRMDNLQISVKKTLKEIEMVRARMEGNRKAIEELVLEGTGREITLT